MTVSRRFFLQLFALPGLFGITLPVRAQNLPKIFMLKAMARPAKDVPEHEPAHPLGFDGLAPPQILRVKRGETIVLKLQNDLDVETSLIGRGLHGPQIKSLLTIAAKGSAEASIQWDESGTIWLQPAQSDQINRGLGAMLVVEEDQPPVVDFDLPFVVQDWAAPKDRPVFSLNGRLVAPKDTPEEAANEKPPEGDKTPENDPADMVVKPGARIRLRLVNASLSRGFILGLSGTTPYVVAVDSVAGEKFRPVKDMIPVGPGARFDLLFDVGSDKPVTIDLNDGHSSIRLQQFRSEGEARPVLPAISALPQSTILPTDIVLERAQRADIKFGQKKPPEALHLARGRPAVLTLINPTMTTLSVYLGMSARVLHALDDGWEPYWRDSIVLSAGQTIHVAIQPTLSGQYSLEAIRLDQDGPPERIAVLVN
eukprot:gene11648-11742_t